jgi:hypothetical protein
MLLCVLPLLPVLMLTFTLHLNVFVIIPICVGYAGMPFYVPCDLLITLLAHTCPIINNEYAVLQHLCVHHAYSHTCVCMTLIMQPQTGLTFLLMVVKSSYLPPKGQPPFFIECLLMMLVLLLRYVLVGVCCPHQLEIMKNVNRSK